jgi:uncharacterized protein (DUF2062 family)
MKKKQIVFRVLAGVLAIFSLGSAWHFNAADGALDIGIAVWLGLATLAYCVRGNAGYERLADILVPPIAAVGMIAYTYQLGKALVTVSISGMSETSTYAFTEAPLIFTLIVFAKLTLLVICAFILGIAAISWFHGRARIGKSS